MTAGGVKIPTLVPPHGSSYYIKVPILSQLYNIYLICLKSQKFLPFTELLEVRLDFSRTITTILSFDLRGLLRGAATVEAVLQIFELLLWCQWRSNNITPSCLNDCNQRIKNCRLFGIEKEKRKL